MENTISGYLLSPAQRVAWDRAKEGFVHNNVLSIRIDGLIDAGTLSTSLARIVERHELFRTMFVEQGELAYPMQVVSEESFAVALGTEDLSAQSGEQRELRLEELFAELGSRRHHADRSVSLKGHLVKLAEQEHLLFLYSPVIASDLRTMYNVAQELASIYGEAAGAVPSGAEGFVREGEGETLQYAQYAEWHNELQEEGDTGASAYWQRIVQERYPGVALPFDRDSSGEGSCFPRAVDLDLDTDLLGRVLRYGSETGRQAGDVLLAAWVSLIWELVGRQEAFVLGSVVTGRSLEVFGGINGPFALVLPLVCRIDEGDTVEELLRKLDMEREQGMRWQDHYTGISDGAGQGGGIGFETCSPGASIMKVGSSTWQIGSVRSVSDELGLKLVCLTYTDGIRLSLQYDPRRYSRDAIALLKAQLAGRIGSLTGGAGRPLKESMTITTKERELVLGLFNNTERAVAAEHYINLFEAQAARTPGHDALVYQGEALSYEGLNERANRLARYLISERGIKKGEVVALRVKRSPSLLIAMLGIMKAGAVFLPVDRKTPADRLRFMLEDSDARLLIKDGDEVPDGAAVLDAALEGLPVASMVVEDALVVGRDPAEGSNPAVERSPDDAVYIIYTSGSTGRPKGAVIANSSFVNYIQWVKQEFGISEEDRSLLFLSVAFDLSYTNLWSSLISGCSLYILEETGVLEPDRLTEALVENRITFIKLTPSHFGMITEDPAFAERAKEYALRLVMLGGEMIRPGDIAKYVRWKEDTLFVNHYGPTETTVGVIATRIDTKRLEAYRQRPVIGRPIYNNKVYILNEEGGLAPVGVAGEICISGAGLCRGYLNREELMREKFSDDPYRPGYKLYKTGDVGRWLDDGNIQLIGRNDGQVKIRGFRVETGEVAKVIMEDPRVRSAVVLADQDESGELCLRAYVVPAAGREELADLKSGLGAKLPDYMAPAQFIVLDSFPLLPNGKVNRKELLNLKSSVMENELNYEGPKNETERTVAEIWKKILVREQVSTNESFFNIGGNSLKLVKVFRELSKRYPGKLTLTELFKYSSVQAISEYLDAAVGAEGGSGVGGSAATGSGIEGLDF